MKNRNVMITTILLALGCFALRQQVQSATDTPDPGGSLPVSNTADGQNALRSLTTGICNSAFGFDSLLSLTDGKFCTGVGGAALLLNTADENTAVGAGALLSNTTGGDNTANGAFAALGNNTTGIGNTATGADTLVLNTGSANTANGAGALLSNTTGNFNTATGFSGLSANITGDGNTANGSHALTITTGNGNTALGANAGSALTTGNHNIDIGVDVIGVAGESNTIRIGANLDDTQGASACHIGGIYNQLVDPATASSMAIDATGKLGTAVSSRRFKHDIKPMDKASEAILAFKPVTFHYKSDAKDTPCFGLIAEEVAGVNPDLVVRDKEGKPYSVRYDQVNAMLLNEFLKEHKQVQELKSALEEEAEIVAQQGRSFESKLTEQKRQMEALTRVLQRASAHVLLTKTSTN